ncbi:Uncharacterised protein [Mycobacteroides abscessus subsp. abscessus]|nr:Uncharacterised protein [Mycobacteroides abscessus subsp. abscessus]
MSPQRSNESTNRPYGLARYLAWVSPARCTSGAPIRKMASSVVTSPALPSSSSHCQVSSSTRAGSVRSSLVSSAINRPGSASDSRLREVNASLNALPS